MDPVPQFAPNEEQTVVMIELYQQLLITCQSEHVNYLFLLEGQAGTGKTSTIMSLFKYPEFNVMNICLASPTNKALSVMMEKLNDQTEDHDSHHEESEGTDDEGSNRTFLTVFKLMKSKASINSCGETLFEYRMDNEMKFDYDVIVIDEASMIEKQQVENIVSSINKMKFNSQLGHIPVVIFMGDVCQLPPVSESASIVFDEPFQMRAGIKKMVLTKIMRSKNRLTDLSHNIRQLLPVSTLSMLESDMHGVDLKKFQCEHILSFTDRNKWLLSYTNMFKSNLSCVDKSSNAPIILVYTNAECDTLNTECRNLIFDSPDEQFVPGELLVFKNYYSIKRQYFGLSVEGTGKPTKSNYFVKFFTSEPVIVGNVVLSNYIVPPINFATIFGNSAKMIASLPEWVRHKVPAQKMDYVVDELTSFLSNWEFIPSINKIKAHDPTIESQLNRMVGSINKLNHAYVDNILTCDGKGKLHPQDTDPDHMNITVISERSLSQYQTNCDAIKQLIKSTYQMLSTYFRNNHITQVLIDMIFQKVWKLYYYREYIYPFANTTYGYAITSHRAQGSTYENTFVNISNILGCKKADELVKGKSMYTACTRAARTIHILYQKQAIFPIIPNRCLYTCNVCHKSLPVEQFPPINCTIDRVCADKILDVIESMHVYDPNNGVNVFFSDKHKNLYKVDTCNLTDMHINEVYSYLITNNLIRAEIDHYQYSNLILARNITSHHI
jgi:hypothetical protein